MNILIDTHTHTVASGHAFSTLDENARHCAETGMKILASTDHAPMLPGSTNEIFFRNFKIIPRILHGIRIMMGVELNIYDFEGSLDMPERVMKQMDIIIASLHTPVIKSGSIEENTNALIKAAENPYVDIIGHPGDPHYPIDMKAVFKAAAETGTFLELNNASLIPSGSRAGGEGALKEMLDLCKKNAVPVVVGSDAHFYTRIGDFRCAVKFMEESGFPEELVINSSEERFNKSFRSVKNNK